MPDELKYNSFIVERGDGLWYNEHVNEPDEEKIYTDV